MYSYSLFASSEKPLGAAGLGVAAVGGAVLGLGFGRAAVLGLGAGRGAALGLVFGRVAAGFAICLILSASA